jgi:thymidylate synthase (FAD)
MIVELLHHTPLWVASKAIRKCWASEAKSDTMFDLNGYVYPPRSEAGPKDKELIHRVGNKNKHASTLEHLNYSFDIDGISRACLQELARHRHASMSVKSTRYTLKELKESEIAFKKFLVPTGDETIDGTNINTLATIVEQNVSNDIAKYMLPEAYKTSLVWTVNARSLQNFLSLRTDKAALWEIRELANELYNKLPEEHKYLFKEFVKDYE